MSIEIIPPGASAVVTEHGHGRDRGYDRDCDRGSRHPDRWDLSTQQREGSVQQREISDQMRAGFTAEALADCHSDDRVCDGFSSVQKQVSDAATSTVVGFKDAAATAYQLQGQSLLEAAKNAAALSVQGQKDKDGLFGQAVANFNLSSIQRESNFNALTVQNNLTQYNILLDAQKNASAGILLATQIAATAAAQAAECCCELKEKIGDEGQKTRDLINAVQASDLRDRAVRSETALAAYFAAKTAPTNPVV